MIEILGFYFFAITSISLFAISVFSKRTLYAMSALAGGMIFVSGFFFMLNAEFLGIVQIIVYTGAVMVLYAFSMMFFDAQVEVPEKTKSYKLIYSLSIFSALLLFLMILAPVVGTNLKPEYAIVEGVGNTELIGLVVFTKYLVVFELVAVMLLVAMICGIILAHKDMQKKALAKENAQ
ncbi:NADH-quinone oxidoreductase subunit J [Campylobacter geochelonis]|uniref:NADH-quinone oxidoreductase subunit J n=1 Tax=Campylobacter geochelonis TaxID=1780362 RepID=A0A128ECH6_9BACT|nr:NADH-quinone oxidoreductase subunit J [Campylobacter geochelonis]QKF70548.1 NADH:quinone oxidoreductase I, membrane subunit J [Campylobacter geochelonis]CZE46062.1 NADH dehydrogenase subunit J [Campylobacter geochelonis]CZE46574.1 NADH dehydrogenase subunit J [Campylobacter geochelonis]CZE50410.1 NADH dehydrogenase subunit J [Campylobacter geochelonis]